MKIGYLEKLNIFQIEIVAWYNIYGRNFFWRKNKLNLWQWMVLENLLKKTKAQTVNNFYLDFILKYPTPYHIHEKLLSELENDLKPLGLYHQRAKALYSISMHLINKYDGEVPGDENSLLSIPYVGKYITNALLCFGLGYRKAIVDVNVYRVLLRYWSLNDVSDLRNTKLHQFAENCLPNRNWIEYNYGLLDLSAIICKKNPDCKKCCLNKYCDFILN